MNRKKAEILLVGVTLAWGMSYLLMKDTLENIPPFNLIALRFGLAFLVALIVFFKKVCSVNFPVFLWSGLLGLLLTAVFSTLLIGMLTTGVSEAAFLGGIAVVFVPLLHMCWKRQLPSARNSIGMMITVVGIWFLSGEKSIHLEVGSFLCILCSFFYALHILLTRWCVERMPALSLGVYQLGWTAIFALALSWVYEQPTWPQGTRQWMIIIALGLLCSAFGFIGQTWAQAYTSPERVGFIFTLEPVFTAILAAIFLNETLTLTGYVGAACIFGGILLSARE